MLEYNKKVRDLDAFRAYLLASGYKVAGVAKRSMMLFIQPEKSEEGDPTALVNAYVDPDYYEITAELMKAPGPAEAPVYLLPKGVAAVFTVKRRKGLDGSVLLVNESIGAHFHGSSTIPLSSPTVALVNGVGQLTVGPPGQNAVGGFLGVNPPDPKHPHVHVKVVG